MKVTVLGATGGAGRAITTQLVADGHDVTAANRAGDARFTQARPVAAHARGEVPGAVIGRASDYFGPGGANSSVSMLTILPALRGRRMRVIADPDQPHALAYLPDVGRGFSRLVTSEAGDGRAWVLPAEPVPTQRELVELVAAAAGVPARFAVLRPWTIRLAARLVPSLSGVDEVIDQFDRPWEVDGSGYVATYGDPGVTALPQAVADTVAWYRSGGAS